MTKEEFKVEYFRALAKSDWPRALRAVDTRIEFSDDEDELECLGAKGQICRANQPKRTAWEEVAYFLRRRRKVTE